MSADLNHCPSPPFRGEREGPNPQGWEGGEVGGHSTEPGATPPHPDALHPPRAEREDVRPTQYSSVQQRET
jgi:hypothetical protein